MIKKENVQFKLSLLDEFKNFELKHDSNYKNGFNLKPEKEEILIKENFLMAIINFDVLSELNIPSIFIAKIEKSNWIKN